MASTRSRARAAEAIRAGRVLIGTGGMRVAKPSELIEPEAELTVTEGRTFVSRGGIKLANALDTLGLDVTGLSCLDAGASTGGFTDCLLKRGAERVIALDVSHGQLDWTLRNDDRVHVMERVNARELGPGQLPYTPASRDDRRLVHLARQGDARGGRHAERGWHVLLAMVKPQFELGRARVKAGVVRDAADRREALMMVATAAAELGLAIQGFASSELPGPKGNRETFLRATRSGSGLDASGIAAAAKGIEP